MRRLGFALPMRLAPVFDLVLKQVKATSEIWEMTGTDPQFILNPGRQQLCPGMYRLTVNFGQNAKLDHPKLYIDVGNGFSEAGARHLIISDNGLLATIIFELSTHATLRFDPSQATGELEISNVKLRRLSTTLWRAGRVLRAVRKRINSPANIMQYFQQSFLLLRQGGWPTLRAAIARVAAESEASANSYKQWIHLYDKLTPARITGLAAEAALLPAKPLISVLMPTYNTPVHLLKEAIESVRSQIYQNWELCIADDASTDPHVRTTLEHYAIKDRRIKTVFRKQNGHISRASNSALEIVSGNWTVLLDHDDLLRPHALLEIVKELLKYPNAEMIYSDEDKLDGGGVRFDAFFKPDFSPELFFSMNYLNHLTAHRTENIRAVGGWRPGFEGSQDYDLSLRIIERINKTDIRHISKILYHWRAIEGSTASGGAHKSYAWEAGKRALAEHFERMKLDALVTEVAGTPFYRIKWNCNGPHPLVSLIIPTRDGYELLVGCVSSIRDKTTYDNYELIVVDNGSTDPQCLAYLEEIALLKNVRVLRYDEPFNYSAINNFAVRQARGSIIGLVNNDIEVISPEWLTEMVSWAVQPEIGCVGAKLIYANGKIQHGGVILGLGGIAEHAHKHFDGEDAGYFGRLAVVHNVSAVTAACLVVRRELYDKMGGLRENELKVAFNDVDFCLRVREAGYRNLWTPFAALFHLESVSRGKDDNPEKMQRFANEISYMEDVWGDVLRTDPYYSPNLSLTGHDFALAFPPRETE